MFATTTPKSSPVLWQGETQDGYTLRLSRSGLAKIMSKLKQTGLETLVKSNMNGTLEGAVVRSIAQIVNNATRSETLSRCNSGTNTQVYTAFGRTRNYQILTQPLGSKQAGIISIRSLPREMERGGEQESEYESGPKKRRGRTERTRRRPMANHEFFIRRTNSTTYTTKSYRDFISALRTEVNAHRGTNNEFTVRLKIQNVTSPEIQLTCKDVYLIRYGGKNIPKQAISYDNSDPILNLSKFKDTCGLQLDINTQGQIVKVFAFILSEAVRFDVVRNSVETLFLNSNKSIRWSHFAPLLKAWDKRFGKGIGITIKEAKIT